MAGMDKGKRRTWEIEGLEMDNWFAWQQYFQGIREYDIQGQWEMDTSVQL